MLKDICNYKLKIIIYKNRLSFSVIFVINFVNNIIKVWRLTILNHLIDSPLSSYFVTQKF